MANGINVTIEKIEPDPAKHPPMFPLFFVTMERTGENPGVWEETCFGEEQLRLCLNFFQAGVQMAGGGHADIPPIPR